MPATKKNKKTKHCPFCAELIKFQAVKCRFCGEFLYGDRQQSHNDSGHWDYEYEIEEDDYEPEEEKQDQPQEEDLEDEDSNLLYWGRPSVFLKVKSLLVSLVLITIAGFLYYYPVGNLADSLPRTNLSEQQLLAIEHNTQNIAVILGVIAIIYLLIKIAKVKSAYYEVTVDRIEYGRGILSRKVDNLDMFRVIDLKLRRSLFDCLVGTGTVILRTKDESHPEFKFIRIRRCHDLYDSIKEASLSADRKQGVLHVD